MKKLSDVVNGDKLNEETNLFIERINDRMYYKASLISDLMNMEWLDEIELVCPYIDNLIRAPRLTLISDENVLKIEKVKKITVASVKDLSVHTQFIDKIDPKTQDVQPSKLLDVRNEDSFNTYENRFAYTTIKELMRFLLKKKDLLDALEMSNDKLLEYEGTTTNSIEKVTIELKITSNELPKDSDNTDLKDEIEKVRERLKRVNDYVVSWQKSEMITSLDKLHVPYVRPPIRKTNLILRNPNFQMVSRLWLFLQTYDDDETNMKDGFDTAGNEVIKDILRDSFLTDYFVLNSISSSKKEQREKLGQCAVLMIKHQLKRSLQLLLNSGIEITDSEIMSLLKSEVDDEKGKRLVGQEDVKKKFKNAMDDYLSRTKEII